MKDRTKKTKPHLGQTIEGIGMMSRSLQALYEREYPTSPMMFAIMAEGTIDQLRDLLDDVEWHLEDMLPQRLRQESAPLEEAAEPVAWPEAA